MNEVTEVILIIGCPAAGLLIVLIALIVILRRNKKCRNVQEVSDRENSMTGTRQGDVSGAISHDNECFHDEYRQNMDGNNQNLNNTQSQETVQLQYMTPPLEPSAPPLPEEYFMT